MHLLKYLPLLFLLVSCQDDDDLGPDRGPFCLETDDFANCRLLTELSADEHFDLLVGTWVNVENRGGMVSNPAGARCGFKDPTDFRIMLLADSTFVQVDGGDAVSVGRWFVQMDTFPMGIIITLPRGEGDVPLRLPTFICNNNLGYSDSRAIDGFLAIFVKE